MFGGMFGPLGPYTIFEDYLPAGTIHSVEWQTAQPIKLTSFNLFANHDHIPEFDANNRGFSAFRLFAQDPVTSNFELLAEVFPSNPYDDTPGNTASGGFLALSIDVAPTVAQVFRAEFVQYGDYTFSGPRIQELDGFGVADSDGDGWLDDVDNCPTVPNEDQADVNGDERGDACVSPGSDISGKADVSTSAIIEINAEISQRAYVGDGAHIGPDAMVDQGAFVGEGAFVGAGASIDQGTYIGPGAIIGAGANVDKNTVICAGAEVLPNSTVGKNGFVDTNTVVGDLPANKVPSVPGDCSPSA
jgi:carbonic anhydrase/acetyltransferase-like protein (isoleucine patch superfamily)